MKYVLLLIGILVFLTSLTGCIYPNNDDFNVAIEEAEGILYTQEQAAEMVSQLSEAADANALQAVADWVRDQPLVDDAQLTTSGDIEILYDCGLSGWVFTSSMAIDESDSSSSLSSEALHESLCKPLPSRPKNSGDSKNALILLPHDKGLSTPTKLGDLINQLKLKGYNVDGPLRNQQASLDRFRDFCSYDLVYLVTHGVAHEISLYHEIALATGTEASPPNLVEWFLDNNFDVRAGIEVMTRGENHYIMVNGRFFDDFTYPGTLIIANACESLKYDTLANAFLDNGAECFIGWTRRSNMHFINIATAAIAQALEAGSSTVSNIWVTPTTFSIESWGRYAGVTGDHTLQDLFPRCDHYGWFDLLKQYPNYEYRGDYDFASYDGDSTIERRIAYFSNHSGNSEIWTMNSTGSDRLKLTNDPSSDWDPVWSPSGDIIMFEAWRDGNAELYTMSSSGANQDNLTNHPAEDAHPDWSPAGNRIVFSSDRHSIGSNHDIYVMDSHGSNVINLTNDPGHDWYPAWSPDGSTIAFSSNRDGQFDIYVMNTNGGNLKKLTQGAGECNQPAWSPDGNRIAYFHTGSESRDIYVMNANGSNKQRVTSSGSWEDNRDPCWAPGPLILFSSNQDGDFEIYSINPDGSEETQLTHNACDDFHPAWAPAR